MSPRTECQFTHLGSRVLLELSLPMNAVYSETINTYSTAITTMMLFIYGAMVSLAAIFLLIAIAGYTVDEMKLRLVGPAEREGRLEVFLFGEWGTVCDSHFNDETAQVLCSLLNYPR